jgi:hypothetical protein
MFLLCHHKMTPHRNSKQIKSFSCTRRLIKMSSRKLLSINGEYFYIKYTSPFTCRKFCDKQRIFLLYAPCLKQMFMLITYVIKCASLRFLLGCVLSFTEERQKNRGVETVRNTVNFYLLPWGTTGCHVRCG